MCPNANEEPEHLSREDAARWHMGMPENPMVIGALLLFDRRLALEALEEKVLGKLVPHRRFRQHVVAAKHWFRRPSWRDDAPFELRAHVGKLSLPEALDVASLSRLVSERMSAPLPPERSPWSLELVDLAPDGSALIARFHHCIADGRALVAVLEELTEGAASGTKATSGGPRAPRQDRRGGFLGRLAGLFRLLTLSADPLGFLRRPPSGHKRVAWSDAISLEQVRSIARARGHHVADVLLAGVAGALQRYARAHGHAPRAVRALLPVSVSSGAAGDGLGNHYASVFVRLPIATTAPGARLELIAREMDAVRHGAALRVAIALMKLAGAAAPALERAAVRWWARRASLVVSSLPGPTAPVGLAGQRLRSLVVLAPAAASVGLSVTFFGYAGAMHLGVLADAAVIDRPDELVAGVRAALDELGGGAPPGSP